MLKSQPESHWKPEIASNFKRQASVRATPGQPGWRYFLV